MSGQLSYVHPQQHAPARIVSEPSQATAASMAAEARRWKEEHGRMQGVASELAFQTSALQKELAEVQAKHRNLHANHVAMQTKYQALKQETEGAGADALAEQSEKHLKWKARAQQLAEQFEAHAHHTTALQAEHTEAQREALDLEAEVEGLRDELEEARSDAATARAQAARTTEAARKDQDELANLRREAPRVKTELEAMRQDQDELAIARREAPRVRTELKAGQEARVKLAETETRLAAARAQASKELDAARAQAAKDLEAAHAQAAKERKSTIAAHAQELETVRSAAVSDLATVRAEAQRLQTRVSVDSVHEASRTSTELLQARAELDGLRKLKEEVPAVQARLKQGEAAAKELVEVQARAEAATKELATARMELAAAQQRSTGADRSVREAMRKEQAEAVAQAVARQAEAMGRDHAAALASAGQQLAEKYERTARQQAEGVARATDSVKACAHMLTTAERVLRTCAEVQALQEAGGPMAQALDETAAKLAHFLKALPLPPHA
jgi:chromosome segregation ATPase